MDHAGAQTKRVSIEDQPQYEPIRAQTPRTPSNPSREDLRVRRRQRRAQRPVQPRTAALECRACGCRGVGQHGAVHSCPACGSLAVVATVLDTQVERLNPGIDHIRTPTGQTSEVINIRPHPTDGAYVYLDTDLGTTRVKRGTPIQVVPQNTQQQELPNIGDPAGGNTGELPFSGRTPSGQGGSAGDSLRNEPCPNCGRTGTLAMHGGFYECSNCGHKFPAGKQPGGMAFSDQKDWAGQPRERRSEAPLTNIWSSRYADPNRRSAITARAHQVLGTTEEIT